MENLEEDTGADMTRSSALYTVLTDCKGGSVLMSLYDRTS